jgi:DNA-binding Xre family transcriptional regulator
MTGSKKRRIIKNRLLELIQEEERKLGRRVKQRDIATFAEVRDHTIIAWIRNEVTRFDAKVVERLCDYFDCEVQDLLYFEYKDSEESNQKGDSSESPLLKTDD